MRSVGYSVLDSFRHENPGYAPVFGAETHLSPVLRPENIRTQVNGRQNPPLLLTEKDKNRGSTETLIFGFLHRKPLYCEGFCHGNYMVAMVSAPKTLYTRARKESKVKKSIYT